MSIRNPDDIQELIGGVDARGAINIAQAGAGFLKRGGNVVGATLAAGEGLLNSGEAYEALRRNAARLGMTTSQLSSVSMRVRQRTENSDNQPVETTARFGATTAASVGGAAATGAMLGTAALPVIGTAVGLGAGIVAGTVANNTIDTAIGTNWSDFEQVDAINNSIANQQPPSQGDILLAVLPQLNSAEQQMINNTLQRTQNTDGVARQYDYMLHTKAHSLLSALGLPYNARKSATRQISQALSEYQLPAELLLVDDHNIQYAAQHYLRLRQQQQPHDVEQRGASASGQPARQPVGVNQDAISQVAANLRNSGVTSVAPGAGLPSAPRRNMPVTPGRGNTPAA